jgi:hypothetical protein
MMSDAITKTGLTASDVKAMIEEKEAEHREWMRTHKAFLKVLETREKTGLTNSPDRG